MNDDLFTALDKSASLEIEEVPSSSYWRDAASRLKANPLAMTACYILAFLFGVAIFAPLFSSHSYYETHLPLKNQPPSHTFWFGTDELGRDIFTRCWWGARISLFVGVSASLIDLCLGVLYGATAAFASVRVAEWMMRIADILSSIPYLLVVILLMMLFGSGMTSILLALTLTGWINMARIVRGQLLQTKQCDFVMAAKSYGASKKRILFQHLIPNAMAPIIVTLTLTIPSAIFAEAFLSFLGLGIQAPIASWGTMASDGLPALKYYPWRLFFPAILISITMLEFNILGDALRDAFDPRMRR